MLKQHDGFTVDTCFFSIILPRSPGWLCQIGSNAGYLNELTAKATGKEVHAGPGEATAIGNITAQMIKEGEFKSVEEARTTIHESFGIKIFKA